MGAPVPADANGRAVLEHLGAGPHEIQAAFVPRDGDTHDPSTSPVLRQPTADWPAQDDDGGQGPQVRWWWIPLLFLVLVAVLYLILS